MLRLLGRSVKLGCFVCSPSTGSASTTSTSVEMPTASAGWRIDFVITKPQTRDSCRSPFSALQQRRRLAQPDEPARLRLERPQEPQDAGGEHLAQAALDVRSPSLPSSAGSTVSEPTSEVKTTSIAPIPIEVKIFVPANSIPAIAISTVTPEISTACPEVAAARKSASCPSWPAARSSRSRFK